MIVSFNIINYKNHINTSAWIKCKKIFILKCCTINYLLKLCNYATVGIASSFFILTIGVQDKTVSNNISKIYVLQHSYNQKVLTKHVTFTSFQARILYCASDRDNISTGYNVYSTYYTYLLFL